MKKVVLILLLFFLISCSKEIDKNLVIKDFNINKYLGTWYEIARFNHIFEKNLYNVKAEYSLKDNKIIIKIKMQIKTRIQTLQMHLMHRIHQIHQTQTNRKTIINFWTRSLVRGFFLFDLQLTQTSLARNIEGNIGG